MIPIKLKNEHTYLNPFTESTRLVLHHYLPSAGKIILYDSQGKNVASFSIKGGDNHINLSGLTAGVYVYEVIDKNLVLGIGKLTKI